MKEKTITEKGMTAEEQLYMDLMNIIHYATEKAQALKFINQFKKEVCIDFLTWLEEEPQKEMIEKIVDEYLNQNS